MLRWLQHAQLPRRGGRSSLPWWKNLEEDHPLARPIARDRRLRAMGKSPRERARPRTRKRTMTKTSPCSSSASSSSAI